MWKRGLWLFALLALLPSFSASASDDLLLMNTAEAYESYLARYVGAPRPETPYVIEAVDYASFTGIAPVTMNDYEGVPGASLYTASEGDVTWTIDIPETGLYTLYLHYNTVEGKGKDISRTVLIDGQAPYDAAIGVKMRRAYRNTKDVIAKDAQGNDIRPGQEETPMWRDEPLTDARGWAARPLAFYLTAGTHELTLSAVSEPLVLRSLTLRQEEAIRPYADVLEEYERLGYAPGSGVIRVEAENASLKSSSMLYARSDRSSVSLSPSDPALIKINTIGGASWSQAGQWIEWTVEAPESGLYTLTLHARQDFVRGLPVLRKLTIDGRAPFAEAEQLPFQYAGGWQYVVLSDAAGQPYQFYFEKGTHTLRLTNVLGDRAEDIRLVQAALGELNAIYRSVVMITGVQPDSFRDYQLSVKLPRLREQLSEQRDCLQGVLDHLQAVTGALGERESPLVTMINQLTALMTDVERVVPSLSEFRSAIGGVGTWLTGAAENPLQLDTLYFVPVGQRAKVYQPNFFENLWYEARSLVASYSIDYQTMGGGDANADTTITVWVATGRDQANIIKSLSDELFAPQSGVNVELALVDINSLLPAILSGQGPDVAMLIGGNLPMNYAMRGAVADLTQFDDFDEVASRFHQEALTPFRFRDACYALPETLSFPMLFYRKDILSEIGLQVPETWDEVKAAISVLSKNNMWFGMGSLSVTGQAVVNVQTPYSILLYQRGGAFYTEDGVSSALSQGEGIAAFRELIKLYSDYSLESDYDFSNLFRSGVMPLGMTDMGTFNTLQVFAPELNGLWGFTRVPGTVREDGTIDHTVPCGGLAIVMMEGSRKKDAAWEYLKWWTSTDTQVRYGRELETLMGAAARYPSANLEALTMLPWDDRDLGNILLQYESVRGVPEVPGGYYTSRCLGNAYYDVVVEKNIGAREALIDQVAVIDAEIAMKREEFGLSEGGDR